MTALSWALLAEFQGRLQADLARSLLEASGIEIELFQEAVGHYNYPVTVNGLGRVQAFVPTDKLAEARRLIADLLPNSAQD